MFKNICRKERKLSRYKIKEEWEPKGIGQPQRITRACWFRAEEPPFSQIAKVLSVACVSVHPRLCPLHRYRSVGHSPRVHGTPAQYKLATSTYLNVVRHRPLHVQLLS
jgi:hypothetical protein